MSCCEQFKDFVGNFIVVIWGADLDVHNFADRTKKPYFGHRDNSCAGAYEVIFTFDEYNDACDLLDFAIRYRTSGRINMEFYDAVKNVEEEE